jgi:dihydroneopterin aldolase
MDRIVIPGIPLSAHVGVPPKERLAPQAVVIGLVLHLDLRPAGTSDDLSKTVDYDRVCAVVERVVAAHHFLLIEAIAEEVAQTILTDFAVAQVDVRVEKPGALRARGVAFAAVEVRRSRDG